MSTRTITLDRAANPAREGRGRRPDPARHRPHPRAAGCTSATTWGAIRPLLGAGRPGPGRRTVVFVADLHAMTTEHDPGRLRDGHT